MERDINYIESIVNDLIKKEARPEAIAILLNCDEAEWKEFLGYYATKKDNIACLVLDKAKSILVKSDRFDFTDTNYFGQPYI